MRKSWIDSWKGALIILVVLGHVIGGAVHYAQGGLADALNRSFLVIYMFHMPAFFAVSGYLVGRGRKDRFSVGTSISKRFKRLLVPYFVFGVASAVFYSLLMSFAGSAFGNAGDDYYSRMTAQSWIEMGGSLLYGAPLPGSDGFRCNSVLWFLPCMFSVHLIDLAIGALMPRIRENSLFMVAIALLSGGVSVLLFHYRIPSLPYGSGLALWFYSYFLVGRLLSGFSFDSERLQPIVGGICGKAGWLILSALYAYVCFRWPCHNKFRFNLVAQILLTARIIGGILLSLWFAKLADSRFLASIGKASLGIMLMHKFAVMALQFGVTPIKRMMAGDLLQVSAAILIVLMIAMGVSFAANMLILRFAPWMLGTTCRKSENMV